MVAMTPRKRNGGEPVVGKARLPGEQAVAGASVARRGRGFIVGRPASMNTKLSLQQLAEIAEAFRPVEPAVGPVSNGRVLRVDQSAGLAYVQDDLTKKRLKLSRRFIDSRVFDELREGTLVRFREGRHNTVATLTLLAGAE
jgi:hypothetical protein